jgi:hypothetical protein
MNTFKSSDIGIISALDLNIIHPTINYQLQFSFSSHMTSSSVMLHSELGISSSLSFAPNCITVNQAGCYSDNALALYLVNLKTEFEKFI